MISCASVQIILLLQVVLPVVAGEYCQYDYSLYSSYNSRYCSNGCCGTKYSDYSDVCCAEITGEITGGAIAGIVIGCLVAIGILISFIVCCCAAANNSNRRTGTVIQPGNTGVQTAVVRSTAFTQGQSTVPSQQRAVGYSYPTGVRPPLYVQVNIVSLGNANQAYPPPLPAPAKY